MRVITTDTIKAEIEYVNKILRAKKKGLSRLALEDYNFTQEQFENTLKEFGYTKIKVKKTNQFVNEEYVENTVGQSVGQVVGQDVGHTKEIVVEPMVEGSIVPFEEEEINKFKNIINEYDTLISIINTFKNNPKVNVGQVEDIVVQLPKEENGKFKVSARLNEKVWQEFQMFCGGHKQFTQKELHSMALVEYIKNHS